MEVAQEKGMTRKESMRVTEENSDESMRLKELVQFQLTANLSLMARVTEGLYDACQTPDLEKALDYVYHTMLAQAGGWCAARQDLINNRITPKALES